MPNIFKKELRRQLGKAAASQLAGLAYGSVKRSFDVKKRQMLGNFQQHDVTLELEEGPSSDGGVLSYGNLYSFLGFNEGTNVTEDLYDELNEKTILHKIPIISQNKDQIVFSFSVESPSLSEMENIASKNSLDWDGRSWLYLLEKGIPNFGFYIFKKFFKNPPSRSTAGLQKKKGNSKRGKAGKIPYISQILRDFKDSIS